MNPTHYIIRNRAEVVTRDGWIHIVPKGELPNHEAGVIQVLDDTALDSILQNIQADADRLGDRWPGIYAGREHFIYNDAQDSAALAWFRDFEKRGDGIWAKDDGLTDIGQEAIRNKRYKFTSFVADRRDTQSLGGNRVRILKLDTVGFTNQANGKELLTPITNRQPVVADDFAGPGGSAAHQKPQPKGTTMKSIATKLGLAAEASEDAILAEVTKLQNRAETAERDLTPLKNRVTELETEHHTLLGEQVDALLDAHQVKDDKVRNRLKPVLTGLKNREDRVAALTDFGFKPGQTTSTKPQGRVLNRQETRAAAPDVTDEEGDKVRTDKITNRANELKGQTPQRSFEDCWNQARREQNKAAA
jgi:phage I-like protein